MDDTRYQVLITGKMAGHVSRDRAVKAFAEILCLSPQEAALRFAAAPFILRGRLSREQADKYCRVIRRQGIDCEARPEILSADSHTNLSVSR
jgi:hypothetical protein